MSAHDVMPDIELYQPVTVEDAITLAERYGENGWLLAGGQDTYGWLKDRAKRTSAMIDLNAIEELKGIREHSGGIEIGALTSLTEIENNALVVEKFGLLAEAAAHVASPQIRNMGTLGGNLCQDTRCWYYRRGLSCYRAGGNTCYANTPEGMNREHCVFGASRCVAVSPSDTAPALVALEAQMVIVGPDGQKVVDAEDFFVGPNVDIRNMTILEPGEVLTAVRIPGKWANSDFYFEKVADRNVWDFALVSVAAVMKLKGDSIVEARFACGGVACVPQRLTAVEQAVVGKPRNDETGQAAGAIASNGAVTLNYNHFKVPLIENLVRRAVRG